MEGVEAAAAEAAAAADAAADDVSSLAIDPERLRPPFRPEPGATSMESPAPPALAPDPALDPEAPVLRRLLREPPTPPTRRALLLPPPPPAGVWLSVAGEAAGEVAPLLGESIPVVALAWVVASAGDCLSARLDFRRSPPREGDNESPRPPPVEVAFFDGEVGGERPPMREGRRALMVRGREEGGNEHRAERMRKAKGSVAGWQRAV